MSHQTLNSPTQPADRFQAFTCPTRRRSNPRKRVRNLEEEDYISMFLVNLAKGHDTSPASFALNYLQQQNAETIMTNDDQLKSVEATMVLDVNKDQERGALPLTTAVGVKKDEEKSVLTTMDDVVKKGQESNLYVCDVCHKSFTCHQALGGHKSSHSSKPRTVVSDLKKSAKSSSGEKVQDHECQTCHKIFPSGQALGGHMRVHYEGVIGGVRVSGKKRSRDGSVEAVKSPSNEGGAGRVLMDFDLNVALTDEDTLYCDQVESAFM